MIRPTTLFSLLVLTSHGAPRDPNADGAGGDPLPEVGGLVASKSLPGATIPQGVRLRVAADHEAQKVASPTALTFDEQGALYLTETHRFRFGVDDNRGRLYWLMDDFASQTVEDRAKMYEKWREKAPLEQMIERSEIVRKLSGQGTDGRFEKSEVFADGFNDQLDGTAAGVFAYEGTVFLANIPKLYALRDNDGDGKAESREVIEEGFGVRVSFSGHDMNGFALGPDGRIYGTIGDRGFNVKTASGEEYVYPDQGAIFRFEPDGSNFEVIHTGLRNPKEIAFDAWGNAFTVDNNSDQKDEARIVYIVDGGDSGWRMEHQTIFSFATQIGLDGPPPSPWMNERMWEPMNEDQPAWLLPPVANLTSGPSGLTYHPGAGFLESEVGRFLVCDYRGGSAKSGVWSFEVAPKGAGMKLVDSRPLVWSVGATDVEYSWDGRLFITDFVNGWISHDDGRVLEATAEEPYLQDQAEEAARLISEGFDQRSAEELEVLLSHADMRVRTRAQLALTRHLDGFPVLQKVATEGKGFAQLHGIWGLGIVARRGSAALPKVDADDFVDLPGNPLQDQAFKALKPLLAHGDPEVRAQTVRVLGDAGISGYKMNIGALLQDESARVRMFAAIAIGKTKTIGMMGYILNMLDVNDNQDPYLRHAGVRALELMMEPIQLASLRKHKSPAVRLAIATVLGRKGSDRIADYLLDEDPRVADEAIRMIHDRGIESVRPLVAALLDEEVDRERSIMMWRRILHSAFRLGGQENLERVFEFAMNPGMTVAARSEALRLLSIWSDPPQVDQSLGRFNPLPKRDPKPIREFFQSKTAELMGLEGELLSGGMQIVSSYELNLSQVPDSKLKNMVFDDGISTEARTLSISLLMEKAPDDLDDVLLKLTGSKDDEIAMEGLSGLVKRRSTMALSALEDALKSERPQIRQRAWELAADFDDSAVVGHFVGALNALAKSDGEAADAIELLEAAKQRNESEIKKALADYEAAIGSSEDPLASWKSALLGGNADRGEKIFESQPAAQCARCHAAGPGQAGPKLDDVGLRGDRSFLLESLVLPAAELTPGFGMVAATLNDGSTVAGTLSEESEEAIVLDMAGKKKTILRSEISELSEPISAMPPMGAVLSHRELRDLVEWLSEQRKR
ncbi:HEAT repeat domain-containing protein [Haloferula chungangensis]|uniref:HEAT repeat domain-containing protein n=1 Tax=Haloferula chungangensis TaxID=1048331 RepID=A0ABW2L426_9BACT